MKTLYLAALVAASFSLSGCAGGSAARVLEAYKEINDGCYRKVTGSVSVGGVMPGSNHGYLTIEKECNPQVKTTGTQENTPAVGVLSGASIENN